jgi:hypothetical protein
MARPNIPVMSVATAASFELLSSNADLEYD